MCVNRNVLRMATICPRISARQLKNDCADGHLYTADGVRKVQNKYDLHRRVAPTNIKVTARHRLLRKKLCRQMLKNLEDFSKWVATNESTFKQYSRRQGFVWRPKKPADFNHQPLYLAKSINTRSPKLMVWGQFGLRGSELLLVTAIL